MQVHSITGIERGKREALLHRHLCLRGEIHGGTEATILKNNAPVTNEDTAKQWYRSGCVS